MKLARLQTNICIIDIERRELESLISVTEFSRRNYSFDQKFSKEVRREFFASADTVIQNLSQQLEAFNGQIKLDKKYIISLTDLLMQVGLENSKIIPPGGMPIDIYKKLDDDVFGIFEEAFPMQEKHFECTLSFLQSSVMAG